ncbi:MAG: hypothetical protein IKD96_01225, partial [Oscillospiraceae bacterium]|nr:hypothetical protein [Oscillospiraceae bacterium]
PFGAFFGDFLSHTESHPPEARSLSIERLKIVVSPAKGKFRPRATLLFCPPRKAGGKDAPENPWFSGLSFSSMGAPFSFRRASPN